MLLLPKRELGPQEDFLFRRWIFSYSLLLITLITRLMAVSFCTHITYLWASPIIRICYYWSQPPPENNPLSFIWNWYFSLNFCFSLNLSLSLWVNSSQIIQTLLTNCTVLALKCFTFNYLDQFILSFRMLTSKQEHKKQPSKLNNKNYQVASMRIFWGLFLIFHFFVLLQRYNYFISF